LIPISGINPSENAMGTGTASRSENAMGAGTASRSENAMGAGTASRSGPARTHDALLGVGEDEGEVSAVVEVDELATHPRSHADGALVGDVAHEAATVDAVQRDEADHVRNVGLAVGQERALDPRECVHRAHGFDRDPRALRRRRLG
jgi:hypothetical protein